MYYVYILQSMADQSRFYVGYTANLKRRLSEHNNGNSIHTNKYRPWSLRTYIGFDNEKRAANFETYLKTASGRAFMSKRF